MINLSAISEKINRLYKELKNNIGKAIEMKLFHVKNENINKVIEIFGLKIKYKSWLLAFSQLQKDIENIKSRDFDIDFVFHKNATLESAEFAETHLLNAKKFPNKYDLLTDAVSKVNIDGLFLEFGVFSGKTINHIAKQKKSNTIYGFDSFEGLPETWRSGFEKGVFGVDKLPDVENNVTLIKGWFDSTLPEFIKDKPQNCAFIHVDCDLYSSTKTIFDVLSEKIVSGTVIVFDEFFNYPGWKQHEYKAFMEFVNSKNFKYEFIGFVPSNQQLAVKIL